MKLEFVNHASFVAETHGVRLLCDPWLRDPIFNDGWDLLAKSTVEFDDFVDITHIWFSHEHPDHFYPPNLKEIPARHRRNIRVLFQQTKDQQVVNLCRKLGFRDVVELSPDEWFELVPGLQILCRPLPADWGECDSWMCLKTERITLLNLNDCEAKTRELAEDIQRRVGAVDVLFTQFSYAGWFGNPNETERRRAAASRKLEWLELQANVLQPRFLVPFASFVWFCHEENFFMNAEMNTIKSVREFIRDRCQAEPVILRPGDRWTVGESHDSQAAVKVWEKEHATLGSRPLLQTVPTPSEELLASGRAYIAERRSKIHPLVAHLYAVGVNHPLRDRWWAAVGVGRGREDSWHSWLGRVLFLYENPVRAWVRDHNCCYEFNARRIRIANVPRERCDVALSAASLLACFRFPWGCETLVINGRFEELHSQGVRSIASYFRPGRMLHHGHKAVFAEASKIVLTRAKRWLLTRGLS